MKKRYMCPMTTTILAETCSICAGSPPKWTVDKNQDDTEVPEYNWGEIIWDKGQGFDKDPFDPDNW